MSEATKLMKKRSKKKDTINLAKSSAKSSEEGSQ